MRVSQFHPTGQHGWGRRLFCSLADASSPANLTLLENWLASLVDLGQQNQPCVDSPVVNQCPGSVWFDSTLQAIMHLAYVSESGYVLEFFTKSHSLLPDLFETILSLS